MALLSVNNLSLCFHGRAGTTHAVNNASFELQAGQTLGIVGESGSGKSVLCYSLLGLLPTPPANIESGSAMFADQDLLRLSAGQLQAIRGNRISMIFQDPMTSLNPYLKIGNQMIEPVCLHKKMPRKQAWQLSIQALADVGLRGPEKLMHDYPHQLSGGMRQRVMIAMALINRPEILIADEPTTALDVTVQAQILKLIRKLQAETNIAVIFVSHDLSVIAEIADHILVMQQGNIVEQGTAIDIFTHTQHAYTKKLLASIPSGPKLDQYKVADRNNTNLLLHIDSLQTSYTDKRNTLFNRHTATVNAVDNVSLQIYKGETLGLVGESGSGKSTLARSVMRLVDITAGEIRLNNRNLAELAPAELKLARRNFQMIFQDPYASLNPRMTVFDALAEAIKARGPSSKKIILAEVIQLLQDVGLEAAHIRKYPHEFSGGQRQRIAIARALALRPALIIADEPVSALDVTIQAQILELLLLLVKKHELTMLFISHDLSVIRYMTDRTAVMYEGKIVELNETESVFNYPQHPYTKALLSAIPAVATVGVTYR
jgi:ABC-type glutathione transport system ATPase component